MVTRKYTYWIRFNNDINEIRFTPDNSADITFDIVPVGDNWYDYILEIGGEIVVSDGILRGAVKRLGIDSADYFYINVREGGNSSTGYIDGEVVYSGIVNQQELSLMNYKGVYKFKPTSFNLYNIFDSQKNITINALDVKQYTIQSPSDLWQGNFVGCVKIIDVIESVVAKSLGRHFNIVAPIFEDKFIDGVFNKRSSTFLLSTSVVKEAVNNAEYEPATKLDISLQKLLNFFKSLSLRCSLDTKGGPLNFRIWTEREINKHNDVFNPLLDFTLPEYMPYVRQIDQSKFQEVEIPDSEKWQYSANKTDEFNEAVIEYQIEKSIKKKGNQEIHSIDFVADMNGVAANPDAFPSEEACIFQCYEYAPDQYLPITETSPNTSIKPLGIEMQSTTSGSGDVIAKFPNAILKNSGNVQYVDSETLELDGGFFDGDVYFITEDYPLAPGAKITTNAVFEIIQELTSDEYYPRVFDIFVYIGSTLDSRPYDQQRYDQLYGNSLAFRARIGLDPTPVGDWNFYRISGSRYNLVCNDVELSRNATQGGNVVIYQIKSNPTVIIPNKNDFRRAVEITGKFKYKIEQDLVIPNPDYRTEVIVNELNTEDRYLPQYRLNGIIKNSNSTKKRKELEPFTVPYKSIKDSDFRGVYKTKVSNDGIIRRAVFSPHKNTMEFSLLCDSMQRPSDENFCIKFETYGKTDYPIISNESNTIRFNYDVSIGIDSLNVLIESSLYSTFYLTGNDFTESQNLIVTAENGDIRIYAIVAVPNPETQITLHMAGIFYTPMTLLGADSTFFSEGRVPETFIDDRTPSAWQSTYDGELLDVTISTANQSLITSFTALEVSGDEVDISRYLNLTRIVVDYFASARPLGFVFPKTIKYTGNSNTWTEIDITGGFQKLSISEITGNCNYMEINVSECDFSSSAIDKLMAEIAGKGWLYNVFRSFGNPGFPTFGAEIINSITGGTFTKSKYYKDETGLVELQCTSTSPAFRISEKGKYIWSINGIGNVYNKSTGLAGQFIDTGINFDFENDFIEIHCRFDSVGQYLGAKTADTTNRLTIGSISDTSVNFYIGNSTFNMNVGSSTEFHTYRIEGKKLFIDNVERLDLSSSNLQITDNIYIHAYNLLGAITAQSMSVLYVSHGTPGSEKPSTLVGIRGNAGRYYEFVNGNFIIPSTLFTTEVSKFASDTTDAEIYVQSAYEKMRDNFANIQI